MSDTVFGVSASADEAPEFPSAAITGSRRIKGPNLFSAHPGAVLEVEMGSEEARRAVDHWPYSARALATAIGWSACDITARRGEGEAFCFLTAPLDGLMTATLVAEQAWVLAEQYVAAADGVMPDGEMPDGEMPDGMVADGEHADAALRHVTAMLTEAYREEHARMPQVQALYAAAQQHGVSFSVDDEQASVGSGAGARCWPLADVPDVATLDWAAVRDVPTVLVTGSNGKTTTVRLVAAMCRAAGLATGWSCSDGVWVARDLDTRELAAGDYTGPAGARLVVRDPMVQAAVLETARGGMLRRGVAVTRANVAVITNISDDHFGEYGVHSLEDLARVKSIVVRALGRDARLVLNADDPSLVALAAALSIEHDTPIVWFSTLHTHACVEAGVAAHGDGATIRDGHLLLARDGVWRDAGAIADFPITAGGVARHNVANALAAALGASCAGVSLVAVQAALRSFGRDQHDNAGRLEVLQVGGVTVVVDYAHNPAGLQALCETAAALPAARRLLVIGQAGDRDDVQLRALAPAAWSVTPFARVLVKEMAEMQRGREPGAVATCIRDAFVAAGAPPAAVIIVPSEIEAAHEALRWAAAGDLVVFTAHVQRAHVGAYFARLRAQGWRAGSPLPE